MDGRRWAMSGYRSKGKATMRWLHLTVIALFITAIMLFSIQNFQIVTVSFLGFSVRAPLALVVALIYLLGMATGGSLLAVLRRSLEGARRRKAISP